MRNLNRIIFINSANIPYADDIYLDGNIHFIGTQGVGKSTILRAILFFYNADTQKLGIPVEKQSYTEYYFPYSNSYIVYEVATENGPFCILSFKSMNRVCYRFIDSPPTGKNSSSMRKAVRHTVVPTASGPYWISMMWTIHALSILTMNTGTFFTATKQDPTCNGMP